MSLCVYAIASPARSRAAQPSRSPRLSRVRVGRVDAIVARAGRRPMQTTPQALRRYDRVLTALWRRSAALLPVRFGTVVSDAAELERILQARQAALVRQLSLVRNRAQMTLRVLAPGNSPAVRGRKRPRSGAEYLLQRAASARLENEAPELASLRHAVGRWVRAERVERHLRVATLYHLVPRAAADRYVSAIAHAARAARSGVLISGPCPPYAFADGW